ncbi:MAG: dienelactone hydrolase family protein [Thermoanaerobaculia bacterium]
MNLLHTVHVPAGEGPFPTVIAIHGWGASAHDLLGLAPYFLDGEAVVICPQGQVEVPIGPGALGYGWFPLRSGLMPDPSEVLASAEELRQFVLAALAHYPADLERVALLGFSQGGVMAYELGLRETSRFAGIAALSTWFPPQLAEAVPARPEHEGFPVLMIHGTEDFVVPVERARESRETLRPYGVTLTYREFPMAHEIRPSALEVIQHWLLERALGRETG